MIIHEFFNTFFNLFAFKFIYFFKNQENINILRNEFYVMVNLFTFLILSQLIHFLLTIILKQIYDAAFRNFKIFILIIEFINYLFIKIHNLKTNYFKYSIHIILYYYAMNLNYRIYGDYYDQIFFYYIFFLILIN